MGDKQEFFDALERLAVSLDLGHPRGDGWGFSYDQITAIDNLIAAAHRVNYEGDAVPRP